MGRLENGKWIDQWHNTKETQGRYVRKPSIYRNWITEDGTACCTILCYPISVDRGLTDITTLSFFCVMPLIDPFAIF